MYKYRIRKDGTDVIVCNNDIKEINKVCLPLIRKNGYYPVGFEDDKEAKEAALELWHTFDIPIDDDECIEEEWNGFPVGTSRYDIWHWFEETFNVSVGDDLMGQ